MNRVHITDATSGVGSSTIRRQNTSPSRRPADEYVDVEQLFRQPGYSCCKTRETHRARRALNRGPFPHATGPIVASVDGSGPRGRIC